MVINKATSTLYGVHCNCNSSDVSLCVDGGKWSLQSELHAYCLDGSPS